MKIAPATKETAYCNKTAFCAKNIKNPIKSDKKAAQRKQEAILDEVTTSLIERFYNEVPKCGDFRNIVQEFPISRFINGYLTIMPSEKDEFERILTAAVKHRNSDYVCQAFLKVGKNEDILTELEDVSQNPDKLSGIYSNLEASIQKHFDSI